MDSEGGVDKDDFFAKLILEDRNRFDSKAVRIDIENKTVGYLPRANARLYRQRLIEFGSPAIIGICIASIRGGHPNAIGGIADFDVYLDWISPSLSKKSLQIILQPKIFLHRQRIKTPQKGTSNLENLSSPLQLSG